MKAHPNDQLKLLELAGLDAGFLRLQHLAKNLPEQIHLLEIENDRRVKRAAAAQSRGELEDVQASITRVNDDLDSVASRREHDEARMQQSSSVKEIKAYEAELATLQRRADTLNAEREELAAQESAAAAKYEADREAMSELEALAKDLLERRELAKANLKREAAELHQSRKTLVAGLPQDLVKLYDERRKRTGVGAAELVGNVSSASHEVVETADLSRIRGLAADEVAFCPSTGAILVRTSRSDV